ncbi:MAG: hypothetical protein ACXWQO_11370 [Bdellovibrionota bacterium]
MKYALALAFIVSCLSTSAFAAEKICFGSGDAKGGRFVLNVTKKTATISSAQSNDNNELDGKYPANGSVAGRDGQTYLSYHVDSTEGSTDLLVDSDLLKAKTQGLAKVRWQGESFSQSTYFCRDNQ